jgi:hypothetical protein
MNTIDKNVQILSSLQVDITFQDLEKRIKTSGDSSGIYKTALETLGKMQGKWEPAALFQWFDFDIEAGEAFGRITQKSGEVIHLDLGHSIRFLEQARTVMVSVYTIGQNLDFESANASSKGSLLEAYLIDLIGLTALDKTEAILKEIAENQAHDLGWGVSPFLSPGSVHGWNLEEQSKLCSLLPIDRINVIINSDTVLFPLKSIAALIGIGPGYESTEVGSTCDVCNNRNKCEMRQGD